MTEETALLQEAGVYQYRHPLSDAVAYQAALAGLQGQIKSMVKQEGGAVLAVTAPPEELRDRRQSPTINARTLPNGIDRSQPAADLHRACFLAGQLPPGPPLPARMPSRSAGEVARWPRTRRTTDPGMIQVRVWLVSMPGDDVSSSLPAATPRRP